MNSKCFFTEAEQCWTEVRCLCKNAVVYMDDAAAECLHWFYGGNGMEKFFEFGAISIENFSPFVVRLFSNVFLLMFMILILFISSRSLIYLPLIFQQLSK